MTSLASLVLAAAVAQAAAAPQEDPAAVPRGTPADEQLWRAVRDSANGATVAMGRIAQCSFRISYGKYYENLDAALQGSEAERAEAGPLRARLEAEAKAAEAALPERPGIRECRYALRDLGLLMPNLSDPAAKKEIGPTRKRARGCVARLEPLAAKLAARADALEATLAAVDVFQGKRLAAAAAAKDPATAPDAPSAPAPAAAPQEAKP